MFQKKKITDMLPSEISAYVEDLHKEIDALENQVETLSKPDTYLAEGSEEHESEQELLDNIQIGDVIRVDQYKSFGGSFVLKLSDSRIDRFPTKTAALHTAMLHGH